MNTRKPIFAAAKQKGNELELLVYNVIGENFWTGEGVTPAAIQKLIKDAGEISAITVRINSPGGASFDGVAIHNILRQQKVPVTVIVEGLAASAAFTVAMAGDKIQICDGAMMMLHNAWSMAAGDADALRALADTLEKVSGSMRDIYVKRSGLSSAEVGALMRAETWLSAQEAVQKGFATEALSTTPEKAEEAQALIAQFDLKRFCAKVPDSLRQGAAIVPIAASAGKPKPVASTEVPPGPPGEPESEYGMCDCACAECKADEHCMDEASGCRMDANDGDGDEDDNPNVPPGPPGDPETRSAVHAESDTRRVDGEDLKKDAFAYRPDDKKENWKLPISFSTEEKTKKHIRNAIARWSSTDMPDAAEKDKARSRIKAAAKAHDIEVSDDSLKDSAENIARLKLLEVQQKQLELEASL